MLSLCGTAGVPGAVGPGRPRDRHTRACGSEWSISKPARALQPLRRPPHQWCLRCCVVSARPRCRPRALQPGPLAPSIPAVQPEFAIELVAYGSAGVLGAVGPGRPRDRHTRACGSEWSISKPARALRTLRRPPHQWCLVADVCSVRRLVVRPGPAAAHEHRGQALRLEVCSVPPVFATRGVLPGGCMKEISPLRSTVWSCGVPV